MSGLVSWRGMVVDRDGTEVGEIPIVQASVTDDRTVSVRRRLDLTIPAAGYVPARYGDWLHPATSYELQMYRGVGGVEVPVGLFHFVDPETQLDGTLRVQGMDRTRKVRRARTTDITIIAAGTNYVDAIVDLVASRVTFAVLPQAAPTSLTTPQIVLESLTDVWDVAEGMAESIGYEIFWDPQGYLVLRVRPDPSGMPSFEISETSGTLIDASKLLSDQDTRNGVVMTGESPDLDAPVSWTAWDDDPTSPTYRGTGGTDGYGEVPRGLSSPFVTSVAQAQVAAEGALRRELGIAESITLDVAANPRIQSSDVFRGVSERLRIDATYIADSVTLPTLGAGRITARRQVTGG